MTDDEIERLSWRIHSGERPTEEMWALRNGSIDPVTDESTLQSLSDMWSLAFHFDGLFPRLEAAKALVDVALAGDISYPILTNDGSIYDCLSEGERAELFDFIAERIGEDRASVAGATLAEFADEIRGAGPEV